MTTLFVQKSHYDSGLDVLYSDKPFANLSCCKMVKREYYTINNVKLKHVKEYYFADGNMSFNFYELDDGTILSPEKYLGYNHNNPCNVIYTPI